MKSRGVVVNHAGLWIRVVFLPLKKSACDCGSNPHGTINNADCKCRGGVAWPSYGPVDSLQALLFENKPKNERVSIYNIPMTHDDEELSISIAGMLNSSIVTIPVRGEFFTPNKTRAPVQCNSDYNNNLAILELGYSRDELMSYTDFRKAGVSKASVPWIDRASRRFWETTKGAISKTHMDTLRACTLAHYTDLNAKRKVLNFAKAFLKYLSTTRFDSRYHAFELFLEMPKAFKQRKRVTQRIVTTEDVRSVLSTIKKDYEAGELNERQYHNFIGLVLFGAFSGQRPYATIRKLTVGQFRHAVNERPPVLEVLADQDKIRMQHYCPLHPQVVDAVSLLLNKRRDEKAMFTHEAFDDWLRRRKISLSRVSAHFVCGDLRKYCEQQGDVLKWNESNRAYVLTHGVAGVEFSFYRHPLPDTVYYVYMEAWGNVRL
jgi:hypothetical protein